MKDHAPLLERAFELDVEDASYTIEDIEGEVPPYLNGTYTLNGPGNFRRGDVHYKHWLDGDGLVQSLSFPGNTGGGVRYTRRFVRGLKRTEEDAADRALYRTFGTSFENDQLVRGIALASPVNVSVYHFGKKLLAFGEQGLPQELDPVTLETRGEYTFGGRLNAISPFSAHAHFSPDGREMTNFGISFSARRPMINIYRFEDTELVARHRVDLDFPASIHDFTVTPRHAVFYVSPYLLDMEKLAAGATLMDALSWEPERGSQLLVVSRCGETQGEKLAAVPINGRYCLHLVGSFEDGGRLVVDVIELERPIYDQYDVPNFFTEVRHAQAVRYVLDMDDGFALVERQALDDRRMCDFPATDPRKWMGCYNDFWVLAISATEQEGRKFFDQVVHTSWRDGGIVGVWQAPAGCYLGGEPIFLPDPGDEGAGSVICQLFDATEEASSFLLFDAYDVASGPRARLHLRGPTPLGFHASWT